MSGRVWRRVQTCSQPLGEVEGRIGENGIIVKVKARTERSAKGNQRSGEQKKARSHDLLRAYVKRPKTAAERKERVAEILRRLDRDVSGRHLRAAAPQPVGTAGGHDSLGAVHRQAGQRSDAGPVREIPDAAGFRRGAAGGAGATISAAPASSTTRRSRLWARRKRVVGEFGGKVPRTMEEMLTIPGRGAQDGQRGAGDGVRDRVAAWWWIRTCQRISPRLDLTKNTDPVKIEQDLMKIIPKERWILFSHQMILHGRALCVARVPNVRSAT